MVAIWQAALVLYFTHAYVDSDNSDLGKLSSAALSRLLGTFTNDLASASVNTSPAFESHLLPVVVSCIQMYLDSKYNQGSLACASVATCCVVCF